MYEERPHMPPTGRLSELPRSVDVGAVLDGYDVDTAVLVVVAVDHPVVPAPGAVQPVEPELEWLSDPVRAGGQRPVQELDRRGGDLLGQPGQRPAARSRPRDREVTLAHRSAIKRSASSLVSTGASAVPSSASASRISSSSAALPMTSRVSSKDSRSSTLMTTAAGWPCLVITTRPCSRSRRFTTSESRFFTSARGICSLTDIAISIASFSGVLLAATSRICRAPSVQGRSVRSVLRLPSSTRWRSRLPCRAGLPRRSL